MIELDTHCPFCQETWQSSMWRDQRGLFYGICGTCGHLAIEWKLADRLTAPGDLEVETTRACIASWLGLRHERDNTRGVAIYAEQPTQERIPEDFIGLSYSQLVSQALIPFRLDRLRKTLVALVDRNPKPGKRIHLEAYASQVRLVYYGALPNEATAYLDEMADLGWIEREASKVRVTARGWQEVDAVRRGAPASARTVFLASWLDAKMEPAMRSACDAISDAGYEAVWFGGEHPPTLDELTPAIMAGIRACRFLVCDVAGERPSVYFEAGFAMGLGKQVVFTVPSEEYASQLDVCRRMHFDTNHYPHIIYSSPDDLRSQLLTWIRAFGL